MSKNPCSCIRDTLDLIVTSPAREVMLIHDLSNWVEDDNLVYPDIYYLKITDPDQHTNTIEVYPKNGHIYRRDVTDGVHVFELDNCGVVYKQKELLTPNFECQLDIGFLQACDKDKALINDIRDDLSVAKAAAKVGNFESAKEIFRIAKIKLENVQCDCTCK